MRKLLLPLLLLPLSAFAQDTLYVKGGAKVPVTITKVERNRVFFATEEGERSMPETALVRYHWAKAGTLPLHKDNVILIETEDSPEVAYKKLGDALFDSGYSIANSDPALLVMTTAVKAYKGRWSSILKARAKGEGGKTIITLTGESIIPGLQPASPVQFYGMKGSQNMEVWAEMEKVARAYPNGKVSYGKR